MCTKSSLCSNCVIFYAPGKIKDELDIGYTAHTYLMHKYNSEQIWIWFRKYDCSISTTINLTVPFFLQ